MIKRLFFVFLDLLVVLALASLVAVPAVAQLVEKPDLQGQNASRAMVTTLGSTVARSLAERFADTVNAADFGAKPTNSDNTAAFNAAVAAMKLKGGGCVKINQGWYQVAGTITLPDGVGLCGHGNTVYAIGTQLLGTGPSGQVLIDIGTGSDNPMNNVVQDITISFNLPQSAGAGIRVRNAVAPLLQRLTFYTNWYEAIVLSGTVPSPGISSRDYYLREIIMYGSPTGHRGVWVGAPQGGQPSSVINLVMEDVTVGGVNPGSTVDAFYLQNVGGVQVFGGETRAVGRGLVIAPGDNETVDGVLWSGTYFDGSLGGAGIAIVPTGSPGCNPYAHPTKLPLCGRASQIQMVNARPSYALGGVGMLFDSSGGGTINGFFGANVNAGLNFAEGIKIVGSNTKQIHFANSSISYNNVSNTGKSGVYIGNGVSHVTFNGGCASTCSTQHQATVNYQTYGIEIAAGASDYIIQGMDLTNNVTGAVSNSGDNLRWSIFNNLGIAESIMSGRVRIYDRGTADYSVIVDGINNPSGGAAIRLEGDGASTPSKTIRAHQGELQITNSALSAVIAKISDSGKLTLSAGITTVLPTTCSGQPTGTLWNDTGTVKVCP